MKLIIYDRSDLSGRAENKKPALRIYKTQVVLYPELCAMLGVTVDDRVKFAQDKDRPGDLYICKDNDNGVLVRKYGKTSAFSTILGTFIRAVPEHWRKQTILVGTEFVVVDGLEWYPLITAALNNTEAITKQLAKDNNEKFGANTVRDQY